MKSLAGPGLDRVAGLKLEGCVPPWLLEARERLFELDDMEDTNIETT
jgi:hypothetical protein